MTVAVVLTNSLSVSGNQDWTGADHPSLIYVKTVTDLVSKLEHPGGAGLDIIDNRTSDVPWYIHYL